MKKFNKNLTINIPQEQNNSASPYKQNSYITESQNRRLHIDSDEERLKTETENQEKGHIVEFEQFQPDEDKNKKIKVVSKNQKIEKEANQSFKTTLNQTKKKQFSIEIPQIKSNQPKSTIHSLNKTLPQTITEKQQKEEDFRQPPAPSNRQSNSQTKSFIFPTSQAKPSKVGIKLDQKLKTSKDYEEKIEELVSNFDRERQQFYKQRSKFEKDLMVKDGQIQMLQKIISNKISSPKGTKIHSIKINDDFKQIQELILQKDLQINEFLEKINHLNEIIDQKNQQISYLKNSYTKLQNLNESLKNQIYVYERKQQNHNVTKQFYLIKNQKGSSKMWSEETHTKPEDLRLVAIHQRLNNLNINRIELEERNKIKSQIAYSQTTKNKNKNNFDFRGAVYDRERQYSRINKY